MKIVFVNNSILVLLLIILKCWIWNRNSIFWFFMRMRFSDPGTVPGLMFDRKALFGILSSFNKYPVPEQSITTIIEWFDTLIFTCPKIMSFSSRAQNYSRCTKRQLTNYAGRNFMFRNLTYYTSLERSKWGLLIGVKFKPNGLNKVDGVMARQSCENGHFSTGPKIVFRAFWVKDFGSILFLAFFRTR